MKYLGFVLLCLAVLSMGLNCKEPTAYHYKVYGQVVDEAGNPVEGASVVVRGFDIQRVASKEAFTDSQGNFLINFDINPFEWRQEAHWVFFIRKEGYYQRNVDYPEFSFDDRFKYQGYWYEVYFRNPVQMKKVVPDGDKAEKVEDKKTASPEAEIIPAAPLIEAEKK